MTCEIVPFAGTAEEWDGFGARQPGWTHFHRFGWKALIEKVFRHECVYLAAAGRSNNSSDNGCW